MNTRLTVTDAELDGVVTSLRAVDGTITAIGADVVPEEGDEVLAARGCSIVPGMVNGHGHAAMTLFRGFGDDLPLDVWLQTRIWPAEARLDADAVYWGTRLACVEMVRSGTTRFFDMYWHAVDAARAARDVGIRMVASQVVIEMEGAPPGNGPDDAVAGWTALGDVDPLIEPCLAAHAIYTTRDDLLRRIAAVADELDTKVQIHLSETEQEVLDCVAAHGMRPAAYLDSVGLLHDRMVLAHGVWLDDDELALIADRGATVVTNPVSNMKLAAGGSRQGPPRAFPYPAAKEAGVPMGVGTDGAASNNTLDLLSDLKVLALLQKHASGDPSTLPAPDAWDLACGCGSAALGGTPIAVGQPADLLLIDRDVAEMTPGGLVENLVYAANGSVVDSTVVAGRVVMRHHEVPGEDEVRAQARQHAARMRDDG